MAVFKSKQFDKRECVPNFRCNALAEVTGIKLSQSWFAVGVRLRIEFSGWYAKPVKNRLKIWKPVQTSAF
jgi:hypothetical protein